MRALTSRHQGIIEALQRDLRATLGVALPSAFEHVLRSRAESVLGWRWPDDDDGFQQQFVDDIQQQVHDEFIDVSWPRCPRHPNHPLWLDEGQWCCTRDKVSVARLGDLRSPVTSGG